LSREYEPLDLRPFANAGSDEYFRLARGEAGSYPEQRPSEPPVGRQDFRGLPFQVGSPDGKGSCFVAPALSQGSSLTVPIGRSASHVLFAHVLLGSDLWSGAQIGREVARYVFRLSGEEVLQVPIRERFEVGNMPLPWGQYPLLCVPDRHDYLEPRLAGNWEEAGFRQTEVTRGMPSAYFLWAWHNPRQDGRVEAIEIISKHPGFLIAGITLGRTAESPLQRVAGQTVRLTVRGDGGQATRPHALTLDVDRGVASYPQPLPALPVDHDNSSRPGWGALPNETSSPSYARVTALPSATLTLRQGDAVLGRTRWGSVLSNGAAETGQARIELLDPGRNWVRTVVVEEATGRPVPCRVAFQTPEGVPYAPHGHHDHIYSGLPNWNVDVGGDVRLGQLTYAYIDGTCEGWLPRGPLIVDVARGFEYEPLRQRTLIDADQRELRLSIRRWTDMNAEGWYSGDTHVHFLSAQGALTEAAGEDLNVVNLLQAQWGHLFTSSEEFTGRPLSAEDGRRLVWVSQENRQHILGHLNLLGLRRPVMPWSTGGPGEGELGGALENTLSHWADEAHAQNATVIMAHFPTPNAEAPVLIATDRVDGVEMYDQLAYEHLEYYRYLNDGYRLPLVGGTDKMSSGTPVGLYRTYVQLAPDAAFTFESWSAGLREGRTFISSGPLLKLSVEGRSVGDTLEVPVGAQVEVECEARSIFPLNSLQVVARGRVVDEVSSSEGSDRLRLRTRLRIDGPTWIAARCGGPGYKPIRHFDERRRGIMAHTSPVYVATGPEYDLRDASTAQYMLTLIGGGVEYLRSNSPQFAAGTVTHRHHADDHAAYLEQPFREAERAVRQRMRRRA
jgi:hypothetical protein